VKKRKISFVQYTSTLQKSITSLSKYFQILGGIVFFVDKKNKINAIPLA
jgi:hypothetical protein